MKAAHTVLYIKKHTKNARFISCAGHQLYERGVDLEVEGVRYIDMHRGPGVFCFFLTTFDLRLVYNMTLG